VSERCEFSVVSVSVSVSVSVNVSCELGLGPLPYSCVRK
jgi:hypothetical protein